MRYLGLNKEEIETWLRNIVLLPKKRIIDRLERETRGICIQSVLAKWYCGCLTILLKMELSQGEKKNKNLDETNTYGFEEG